MKKLKKGIYIEVILFLTALLVIKGVQGIKSRAVAVSGSGNEASEEKQEKDFVKWVDFNVTNEALRVAYEWDVATYGEKVHINWIDLLAYTAAKTGGEWKKGSTKEMEQFAKKLVEKEITLEEAVKDMKYFSYYKEVYQAVLGGMVGTYKVQVPDEEKNEQEQNASLDEAKNKQQRNAVSNETEKVKEQNAVSDRKRTEKEQDTASGNSGKKPKMKWEEKYGLKAFLPIAKNFPYSDYDDFGSSRSYGYKRPHLGHDMMGQIGTPIIAVESGYVEALGWNQYGGWRIGIRSFDKKRYYYYAHLRQNFPYCKSLKEGSIVTAGDVIGYMGHTGYSKTENVNNIETVHLHFGMEIIFDESQKDGDNEIWISCYELTKFLYQNRSEVVKDLETKEWYRVKEMVDPVVEDYMNGK